MRAPPRSASVPLPLVVIALVFLAAMVFVVVSALTPRHVPTYALPPAPPQPVPALTVDTVTLDAADPVRWRFFSFARGLLALPDTAGWDLAVRRFHVIVAGEAVRLDAMPFDALAAAPAAGGRGGYVATTFAGDTVNPALARWYRYSMFSHLLRPLPASYVIRSRDGRYAKLEFLSYYCPGPEPGCVTFRYLASVPGSRAFH